MLPTHQNDTRQLLLDRVDSLRELIEAHIHGSEANRTLAKPVVDALREAGLFGLAVPAQFGGVETNPMVQMEVIEALATIYPSCGWSVTIGTGCTSILGAFLPDAGLQDVFADNRAPMSAGAFHPSGTATPMAGGYRVNGRWRFASGICHAEWIWAGAIVVENETTPQDDGSPPNIVCVVLPVSAIAIHDNWHTVGLRGTGSCDFSVDNIFVPQAHTFVVNWGDPSPLRGGPRYKIGLPAAFALDFIPIALGIAQRALHELIARTTQTRGKYRNTTLAERQVVHRLVAEFDLKLGGARLLAFDTYEKIWQCACNAEPVGLKLQAQSRAIATYVTEIAVAIVTQAFRYGGAGALFQPNILEILLRDIHAAAQHIMLSDVAYEEYGVELLGIKGVA